MEHIEIDEYTNYRHNAYDGYDCSWGVCMALGGSGNAFTEDNKTCDHCDQYGEYACDCLTEFGQAIEDWEAIFDVEIMLQNLDESVEEIQEDFNFCGDRTVTQYFGGEEIPIHFYLDNNNVIVSVKISDKKWTFIVDNLTSPEKEIE